MAQATSTPITANCMICLPLLTANSDVPSRRVLNIEPPAGLAGPGWPGICWPGAYCAGWGCWYWAWYPPGTPGAEGADCGL